MQEEAFYKLLDRYRAGQCSQEEQIQVEAFLAKNENKPTVLGGWDTQDQDETKAQIWYNIKQSAFTKRPKNYSKVWIAASFAMLAGLVVLMFLLGEPSESSHLITKTTVPGNRSAFSLSDGTRVHLNSQSSLTYPESFDGDTREVTLRGEAFFDVRPNPAQPFIIHSEGVDTRVLGTSFNVKAYPGEQVAVTVVTGKVSVIKGTKEAQLTPGMQALVSENDLTISEIDTRAFVSWKNGLLIFDKASLSEIVKGLERFYGVNITLNVTKDECQLYLYFDHFSLLEALEQLALVSGIEFQFIDQTNIRITGTGCK